MASDRRRWLMMRISIDDTDISPQQEILYEGEPFTGTAVEYSPDGTIIAETDYRNGIRDGRDRGYYPNGQVESEEWYDFGMGHGTARAWYPNGQLKEEEEINKGRLVSKRRWAADGTPLDPETGARLHEDSAG
jgi:antitoxin component YwqK of YwqJK toxin-antitoxin module